MYLQHFGLAQPPFGLAPDPRFFLALPSHQQALNALLLALRGGEGWVAVTGASGTGKTLLCRQARAALEEDGCRAILADSHAITRDGLPKILAQGLGLTDTAIAQGWLKPIGQQLAELAASGRRCALLIDGAEDLSPADWGALAALADLETAYEAQLRVALFGLPGLGARWTRAGGQTLRRRIAYRCRLGALDAAASRAYLRHRLEVAGYSGAGLFTALAHRLLRLGGRGRPGLINILAHKALLAAYGAGAQRAGYRHAWAALVDTGSFGFAPDGCRRPWPGVLLAVGGLWALAYIIGGAVA